MSDFKKAIATVIQTHEGGFQNRKDDPGNWTPSGELKGTKYGVSAKSFPLEDIEHLSLEAAEEIYRKHWGRFAALLDQRLMTKVLDLAVNMQFGSTGPATMILQKAMGLIGSVVVVDGVFGPETIEKANLCDPSNLIDAICSEAVRHYEDILNAKPGMIQWRENWLDRAKWVPPLEGR